MLRFVPKFQANTKGIFYCSIGWRTMGVHARMGAEAKFELFLKIFFAIFFFFAFFIFKAFCKIL